MKIGLCKDCKFWDSETYRCTRVGYADIELDNSAFEVIATADDDQGAYGELHTGPLFGCLKFEPKYTYKPRVYNSKED